MERLFGTRRMETIVPENGLSRKSNMAGTLIQQTPTQGLDLIDCTYAPMLNKSLSFHPIMHEIYNEYRPQKAHQSKSRWMG